MGKDRKTRTLVLAALLVVVFGVSIAYASMSTTLRINGTATMDTSKWKVRFLNLSDASIEGDADVLEDPELSDTVIETFSVKLTKPGDYVTYTFDVTNESEDMDAIIGTFSKPSPTCTGTGTKQAEDEEIVCGNLVYTLKYTSNNEQVKKDDTLAAGETKNLTLVVGYDGESLPTNDVEISDLNIAIIYKQN